MKKIPAKTLRTLSAVAVVVLVCIGLALHTGTGTPSVFGIYDIAAICPLGAIETLIASKTVVPPLLIGLAIVIALTILLGKAFCAWGCPIPLVRRVLGLRTPKDAREHRITVARKRAQRSPSAENLAKLKKAEKDAATPEKTNILDIEPTKRGGLGDSRNWVLGGTVLSCAVFGFPVFCIICPIGLSFATIIAVWRLFQFNETTLSLIVFPAILIIELLVARKWCHKFCPVGALLSLVSRLNKTFVPRADKNSCLMGEGQSCHRCVDACPEDINLHDMTHSAPLHECTKCRECADVCPKGAITFPLLAKRKKANDD